jgi:hypothetical protein
MNKSAEFGVVSFGLLTLVTAPRTLHARDEQDGTVELTIQGESLPVLLNSFATQHGHIFVVDPSLGKSVLGPRLYASGLSLSRAVAVIAAAYGACAVEISETVTNIVPCAHRD